MRGGMKTKRRHVERNMGWKKIVAVLQLFIRGSRSERLGLL